MVQRKKKRGGDPPEQDLAIVPKPAEYKQLAIVPKPAEDKQLAIVPKPAEDKQLAIVPKPAEDKQLAINPESPPPTTLGTGLTDEDLTTITNIAKSRIYDTLKKSSVPDVNGIRIDNYDNDIKNLLKSTFPGYAYPTNHTSPDAELLNNFAAFKYLSMYYNDNANVSDDIKYEVVSTSVTFLNDVIKHLGTVRKSNAEPGKGVFGQIGDALKGVFGKTGGKLKRY
jgi:hypothetical protein